MHPASLNYSHVFSLSLLFMDHMDNNYYFYTTSKYMSLWLSHKIKVQGMKFILAIDFEE